MNIWILTSEYPPEAGGIGTYVSNAAAMFAVGGHQVTVLLPGEKEQVTEEQNLRIIRFVPKHKYLSNKVPLSIEPDQHPAFPYNIMASWPATSYQFADEVKMWGHNFGWPDVIEVQEYGAIGYYTIVRRLLQEKPFADIPILVHLHTPVFEIDRINQNPRYKFPNYWTGQMEKFCLRAADGLLSPSAFLRGQIRNQVDPNLNIQVIPYPFTSLQPGNLSPTPKDVVYFGRMEYRKGVIPLVAGCAKMWQQGHDFRLTLIGGDTEFFLRNISMKAHLEQKYGRFIESGQLVFVDSLPRSTLYERLQQAWCVIVPSLYENFPNTCIEAMSLGKVVVAARSGGQAEMIEGGEKQVGFIFDWEVEGDFAAKLGQALALSAAECQNLGEQAQQRIHSLTSPKTVLAQRETLFEQVIEQGQHPRKYYPTAIPETDMVVVERPSGGEPGLLSVIIPFYNLGEYVEATLQSVLASTYTPLEVIIVDDGSTDPASLDSLDKIRDRNDKRVQIVTIENSGLSNVRNVGVELATSEFVTFVDADDLVEPEFFAKTVNVLQTYSNVAFVYSWVRHIDGSQGTWVTFNTEFPYLLGHNMLTAFTVIRRELFLKYGRNRPEALYLEDFDGWIGMVAAGCIGVSIPEMLVRYRIRSDSMYRQTNHNQLLYLYDVITHGHAEAYQTHAIEIINLLLANGASHIWGHPVQQWLSPIEQLQALDQQLQSQDMMTRLYLRTTVNNLKLIFQDPQQIWQKLHRWINYRIGKDGPKSKHL